MNYKLEFPLSRKLEKYRDRIEATIKPYIEIQTQNNDDVNWWQSKFGGFPYLPKGFEYPKTCDGKYLFLLAQLNFDEIPPLDGFPDRGILQFYIADDDLYGLDFGTSADVDNPTAEDRFKIIYFPQPDFQVENIITNYDFLPELEFFPVHGCCSLQFTKKYAPVSTNDYQFIALLGEEINELFMNHEIEDEYREISNSFGHKIGGYPYFTQEDVRKYSSNSERKQKPDILLFQMDTDCCNETVEIVWGDSGVGNFFIDESALRELDFSKVLYNWDCC
ncbi:YwqG family protein [Microcoleus sp. AR_TQ3_B6]|uniref:YwqG family protein n=1 Tax=Microcoleus sp. AR_TQ3_B6 TaxID=3055284 RepID=UPI002FD1580C